MHHPTAAQEEARSVDDLGLVLIAPAGCGKTEALALRVAGLIERGQIAEPRRVLVTTFSNRARDNAAERLRAHLPASALARLVTVANFHGLSARIFRAHANIIGLDASLQLPDSDWVAEQCRARRLTFTRSTAVQDLLRKIKQQTLDDDEVERAIEEAGDPLALELERLRVKEQRLTYDDLPRLAELILQNDTVAQLYASHFAAIMVDEFQDLTPQQLRLVNRIGSGRTTYAGDLAQGIYGFAGAAPDEVFASISTECTRTIRFSESHRSSPAVLGAVNALASWTGGQTLTAANPARWPGGGLAAQGRLDTTADESRWVTEFARTILDRSPGQRIGVIARTGPRRRFVDAAAHASGLPFHRWDDPLLDTETAAMMRAALDRFSHERHTDTDDVPARLRELALLDSVQDPNLRATLNDAIGRCADLLAEGETPAQVKSRIRVGDGSTLLNAPGLHLLTGHIGKGQQFDWVVVIGAEEGCIPDFRNTDTSGILEEARVFSVMLSRARHGTVITHCREVEAADGRRFPKQPSRFLAPIPAIGLQRVRAWLDSIRWEDVA